MLAGGAVVISCGLILFAIGFLFMRDAIRSRLTLPILAAAFVCATGAFLIIVGAVIASRQGLAAWLFALNGR